ncbi:MAG: 3-oxoacyl-[acyl-carrier-protein] synthase III C-terminal domain-containing protein [Acidobacteriaceae bacterium]
MRIASVASAMPDQYYSQQEIFEALCEHWKGKLDKPDVLERLHQRVSVDGRHLAYPIEEYASIETWGDANDRWIKAAVELGQRSITAALERAGRKKEEIGAIITVSVTGIAAPSLDAKLSNVMDLPLGMRRTPIFGLGCVAGAAGIGQAADYVRAYPDRIAVLLSVELCSLTWQRMDLSVANMIASGLFADGSAAVVVTGDMVKADGPEILDYRASFYRNTEHLMGWDISEEGFQIVLSPDVPEAVYKNFPHDVDSFLADHGMKRSDIGTWIMHTGGPKVLDACAGALGLTRETFAPSWDCLRRKGNMSSASVLLVLEDFMMNHRPAAGTYSILAAVGPGFCSELVLLRW